MKIVHKNCGSNIYEVIETSQHYYIGKLVGDREVWALSKEEYDPVPEWEGVTNFCRAVDCRLYCQMPGRDTVSVSSDTGFRLRKFSGAHMAGMNGEDVFIVERKVQS